MHTGFHTFGVKTHRTAASKFDIHKVSPAMADYYNSLFYGE